MDLTVSTPTRAPRLFTVHPDRAHRLSVRVALADAARHAGMTLTRASEIEREPGKARPGELDRLRAGVDLAARGAGVGAP